MIRRVHAISIGACEEEEVKVKKKTDDKEQRLGVCTAPTKHALTSVLGLGNANICGQGKLIGVVPSVLLENFIRQVRKDGLIDNQCQGGWFSF